MKPKDLKAPFKWEERQPAIQDQVLFVPHYYFEHDKWQFPGFEDKEIFGRTAPIFIEYCSGNGDWIVNKALEHPEYNWIAVEKRFDRVRKIWSKRENQRVKNLWIVSGEAYTFSRYYLPSESIAGIYVNFPDPWPKGKHSKHRLLHAPFVGELSRISQKEALSTFVTDDKECADRMCAAMQEHPTWTPCFEVPHYPTEKPGYGTSFFDSLWRSQGKNIHYLTFKRVDP